MIAPYLTKAIPYDGAVNFELYDLTDIILFGGGCWLWVIAYMIIIHNLIRYKKLEMPTFVGAGNFAWEFYWAWIGRTNMGFIALYAYQAWFFLDIFIWYSLLKYGMADTSHPLLKKYFKTYATVLTLLWLGAFFTFHQMNLDTAIGAHSAYILNALISIMYVLNYSKLRLTSMVYSMWVAWLKMIGTFMNTVFMVMYYPDNYLLMYLGAVIFVFDLWYAVWMTKDRMQGTVLPVSKRVIPL